MRSLLINHKNATMKYFSRAISTSLICFVLFAGSVFNALLAQETKSQATNESAKQSADSKPEWKSLFDGKSLDGWKSAAFGGEGEVAVKDKCIVMKTGVSLTGITYTRDDLPKINYELEYTAKRTDGIDFFATVTFPYKDSHCSFVAGGWGGGVVGISSINQADASENETTTYKNFEDDKWYKYRLRVSESRIQAWIDHKILIDVKTTGKKITTRNEVDLSKPFGFSAWQSTGHLKDIRVRSLSKAEIADSKKEIYFGFLKSATPKKDYTKEELATMQTAHLANFRKLATAGHLLVAGPFDKNEVGVRGIVVLNLEDATQVDKMFEADPFIKNGLLELDLCKCKMRYGKAVRSQKAQTEFDELTLVAFEKSQIKEGQDQIDTEPHYTLLEKASDSDELLFAADLLKNERWTEVLIYRPSDKAILPDALMKSVKLKDGKQPHSIKLWCGKNSFLPR